VTAIHESLGPWLDRKLESAPQELAARIRAVLPSDWRDAPLRDGHVLLTGAAAAELRGLLERGCEERWAAPGLLVVDALVTYACEIVAFSGGDIAAGAASIRDTMADSLPPQESVT
jgi:hypothetical protein